LIGGMGRGQRREQQGGEEGEGGFHGWGALDGKPLATFKPEFSASLGSC
jgi:hypothetical protein